MEEGTHDYNQLQKQFRIFYSGSGQSNITI
jgi:hypothetical protein